MELPRMAMIEQHFDPEHIGDIETAVVSELAGIGIAERIRPGETVAITGGSRGIANIVPITATVVRELHRLGAEPFIFPAMGSHGGATADGQLTVLANLGITEQSMGCPILSDMEPVYLGKAGLDFPIHVDRHAMEADHIVVLNRIKAHTKFSGPVESGLMKMMAIGMGKQTGASYYHQASIRLSFQKIIELVGLEVMRRCPILFGLGIVENAFHKTCRIKALTPDVLFEGEQELLRLSKERMARLPFDEIDVLIVDEIGKDISGTGMDVNVTGRNRDLLGDFTTTPRTKRIFVRDLSAHTRGNANGIGLADFTTARLVGKMDRAQTYTNAITAISPEKGAIPIYFDTDREALQACLRTIGDIPPKSARIVHIKNTLDIHRLMVSASFREEVEASSDLTRIGDWLEPTFGRDGNLMTPFT